MRFLGHGLLPCGNTPVAAAMCSPPPIAGRLRAYASARGAIAQCAIRPLVRGYSLALHTPRLLRLCAHRPAIGGGCAHTPPHKHDHPSSATDLSSKLALFRAFRYNIPGAVRDNRAQRTLFKEAPWDSISIEATRGLNLHYPVRYNMSTNRVSSPT